MAILIAVAVSVLAIEIELVAAQSLAGLMQPRNWAGGLRFALVVGLFVVPMGLIPGLLLHTLFVRLHWLNLWQYLVAALLLGGAWCAVFYAQSGVGGAFMGGIIAAAMLGTASFWLLRRPDQVTPHTMAS